MLGGRGLGLKSWKVCQHLAMQPFQPAGRVGLKFELKYKSNDLQISQVWQLIVGFSFRIISGLHVRFENKLNEVQIFRVSVQVIGIHFGLLRKIRVET